MIRPINSLSDLLYDQLSSFPFHNLNLLNGTLSPIGGTCFDHALKLKELLEAKGFVAKLHEAEVCMTGEVTHRLVSVIIEDRIIYLDTGSGWPTGFIIDPKSSELQHQTAGVNFQLINNADHVLVRRFDGARWLDMNRIFLAKQDEDTILDKFKERYKQTLPFSSELRLSWLEGESFFRIANDTLSIFGRGVEERITLTPIEILKRVEKTLFSELIPDLSRYLERKI